MRARLRSFDLTGLLVEELGWDHHPGSTVTISAKELHFRATPIAEKKGFVVWLCEAGDGRIPSHAVRRQIETQITRHAFEHLIVFVDDARREQVWQWVRREADTPDASREYTYRAGQTGEPVLQRLRALKFGLDEEESLTISLVANRVKGALNAEKVTKRFYNHFQEELKDFQRFIEGIDGSTDVDWYASLMLNRLMFIYFIQRRGFLDGDPDYLRSRLERVREARGPDSFHDFYRIFLRRLFHEGLGRPKAERSPDLAALLGEVPFLNGGIFDVHDLERDNPDLTGSETRLSNGCSTFSTDTPGIWTSDRAPRTTRSTPTCWVISSRNQSTKRRRVPTTPKRTSPGIWPRMLSFRDYWTRWRNAWTVSLALFPRYSICLRGILIATSVRLSVTDSLGMRETQRTQFESIPRSNFHIGSPPESTTRPSVLLGTSPRPRRWVHRWHTPIRTRRGDSWSRVASGTRRFARPSHLERFAMRTTS